MDIINISLLDSLKLMLFYIEIDGNEFIDSNKTYWCNIQCEFN
jgi:hypothetical protein